MWSLGKDSINQEPEIDSVFVVRVPGDDRPEKIILKEKGNDFVGQITYRFEEPNGVPGSWVSLEYIRKFYSPYIDPYAAQKAAAKQWGFVWRDSITEIKS